MKAVQVQDLPLRPVIMGTLVVCVLLALAPWMSGGKEPLAMMIAGGAMLLGTLLAWRQPAVRRLKAGPLEAAWGLFIGFAVLSLLWTANRYSTGVWIAQWITAGFVFALAYIVTGEKRGREWLIRGYLASAGLFCVVAIGMYLTGTYDRLMGPFYWPNPAAAYLIPAVLLVVDRMRLAKGRATWGWLAGAVLVLTSFLLTDSRASTLVLILVGVIYLAVVSTPKRFWIHFLFTLAISFGLSIGLAELSTIITPHSSKIVPGSRLAEAASGESKSLSDRFQYLGSAFEMWFAHPLGGTGAGTYGDVHPQYQHRVISASTSAHNLYIQLLAELGLVGAVLFAGVLLWLGVGVMHGFVVEPETLPLLLGVAGLLMHFGLDTDAKYPALLALLAMLLAMLYRQINPVRLAPSGWTPVVAFLVMVPLVSLYQSDVWANRARADQEDAAYDQAAEHFAAARMGVLYNPDYVNAEGINLYTLGTAGDKDAKGLFDRALIAAQTAERQDPHDGQHYQLEGRVLAALRKWHEAEGRFREALNHDPYNHPDYAFDLASMQLVQGDRSGALKTVQAMLAQYPQPVIDNRNEDSTLRPALANLEALAGNVELQLGKLDAAEAAGRRALKLSPKNLRGQALLHQVELARKPAPEPTPQPAEDNMVETQSAQ